jgi:hypothetical protein
MITKIFKLPLIILVFIIGFFGCEQKFDKVVDSFNNDYQVVNVLPSDTFYYNSADSLITISIKFNSISTIQNVFCDVYASDDSKIATIDLFDDGRSSNGDAVSGDKIFSNKLPLSHNYPNGNYNIKYYVTDKSNSTKQVALGTFDYNNGQNNVAPVISNDIVEPDTAIVTSTTVIQTSIKVFDQNGLSDIEKVYFVVYKPDGTTNNFQNTMFDDGNLVVNGDQSSADGIYSLLIQITSTNAKGTYRIEFQAKDRGGKLSNIINHSLLIQ